MGLAKHYIEKSKEAGADLAKLQYYFADEIMPKEDPRFEQVKKAQLSLDQLRELKEYCEQIGIGFLCTPFFSTGRVEELARLGLRRVKIREADSSNEAMIRRALDLFDEVWVSTTKIPLDPFFMFHPHIRWLMATPKYPFPIEELELSRIEIFDGISDHCRGITSSIAAASVAKARGKESFILEKHVTLDNAEENLDKEVSIDFSEFAELVRHLRAIERIG